MAGKTGGRPPQGEVAKRAAIGLRVTPSLRDKAERAARLAGRSLSQEIELRLEASFRDEELAALAAGSRTETFLRRLRAVIALAEARTGNRWSADGSTSSIIKRAIDGLLAVDLPADPSFVDAISRAHGGDKDAQAFLDALDASESKIAKQVLSAVVRPVWQHPGHVNQDGSTTPVRTF